MKISALVLAGGKATRMGGVDKGLALFDGRTMIDRAVDVVSGCSDDVIISCNRNHDVYQKLAGKVVADQMGGYLGPLAGVHAALAVAESEHLLVIPCDTPLLSVEEINLLIVSAKANPDAIIALSDGEFVHPLHAIIPVGLALSLTQYLRSGKRSVQGWYQQHETCHVQLTTEQSKRLINVNNTQQLV
ncbi:molybdenum cofactor guanylyltransferase MobA [Gammaproteobacteria bacterium AS21]|jgi:molybdopterin-guanine dinucleotide biosynthesis protein A